jgi:amidophosphoribosyltransferase
VVGRGSGSVSARPSDVPAGPVFDPAGRPGPLEFEGTSGSGLREACGVFGVWVPGRPASPLVFDGLLALQHRGQESAGMAVSDGESVTVFKDMGLVASVFDERTLVALAGSLAIGHTRYSTTGASTWGNAQPVYRPVAGRAGVAVAHNGNLTNTHALSQTLGMLPGLGGSDSDLLAEAIAQELRRVPGDLARAVSAALQAAEGAFSLVVMDETTLVGVRDPHGFRPLCLGRSEDGWVIASETCAIEAIGGTVVREIAPGELVVVDADGVRSHWLDRAGVTESRLCLFEFVYFARPDSRLLGQEVHAARCRMGERLATVAPVAADLVIGVPDSGVPAAEGYARASGIPFGQGLVKNRYIGRTFIEPEPRGRAAAVRRKLRPLPESVAGRRLVVVDDSIVRGTTTAAIVGMLRQAGATEVHVRISSPPYVWPCHYGIDTPARTHLLAAGRDLAEIQRALGADSVAYLPLAALRAATGAATAGFCDACLTGAYPVPPEAPERAAADVTALATGRPEAER